MYRLPVILSIVVFLLCGFTFAQHNQLTFKHLTIDDGLSQNSINCIHQDTFGFMWFGTHDGLNRYDGYEFIHYRSERNNINSLSNNYIYDIYEDADGILWIATFGGGLNKLNPVTGEINRVKMIYDDGVSFPGTSLFSIAEYPKGTLWIGSDEGLIRFDKKTSQSRILLAKKKENNVYEYNYIGTICPDGNDNLWLQSDSGLTKVNTISLETEYFKRSPFSNDVELGNILAIEKTEDGLLVACTAGLVEINLKQKTDKLLLPASNDQGAPPPPVFQQILPLGNNFAMIGLNQGLVLYDLSTNKTSYYQNDAADINSLSHNHILSLYKSQDGIIWIGTRNGINIIETENPNFIHIRSIPGKNSLSSKNVSSFIDHNDSIVWIGTTDGLNLYNKKNNTFTIFKKDEKQKNALVSDYILCLFKDSGNNEWVGTRAGGFYKIEPKPNGNYGFKRVQPVNDTLSTLTVHFFMEGKDGYLWIGTGGAGLWKYNPSNNSVKKYFTGKDGSGLSHPYVFTILEDNFQNIWLGTPSGGVNLLDPKTDKFIYFQHDPENEFSINNDIILCLHQDQQQGFWIGTNDGLAKLIPRLNKNIFQDLASATESGSGSLFKNFGHAQGFPSSVIYGMLEDDHRQLWITTNKGLVVFDMDSEKVVKTYDVSDGLQSNEFNQNAYYKSKNGKFYIGGVNGANIFCPDSVKGNSFIPPVVFTGFSIFNEPVKIGNGSNEDKFTLDKAIYCSDKINLTWKHNVITFEFAALSYINPKKNQFRYKLEGFDKGWVDAGTKHSATYTHLYPGHYIFKVRARNNSGLWNETGTNLKISISAPPWLKWYAYLLYALLILFAIYAIVRFRINKATREIKIQTQIEKAREQEREEFRKKSAADFHDEAGNKITKITLFTEMARTEINNKNHLENYLDKIQLNITELSTGMRDFLWVMDPKHDSLFETLARIKDFGDSILPEMGVQFMLNGMNESYSSIVLPMNTRRDILQIFKEAIHNCAKYAAATKVTLSTKIVGRSIEISLNDNGKGFDYIEDKTKNKYGLSIMHDRAKKIGAKLEINSAKNKGTKISLLCNMPHLGNS